MKHVRVAYPVEPDERLKSKSTLKPKFRSHKSGTSNLRLWIKLIVCICCLFGFIYQTTQFALLYLDYPVIMDMQVKSPHKIPIPAITFCSNNHVLRSEYCSKYPKNCTQRWDIEELCEDLPHLCEHNLTFTDQHSLRFAAVSPVAMVKEMAPKAKDYGFVCGISMPTGFRNCSMTMTYIGTRDIMFVIHSCYKLTFVESEELVPTMERDADLILFFGFQQEEYAIPKVPIFHKISVHEPHSHVSPFFDGISVDPGKVYTIYYQIEEKSLLPPPYQTMCKDYIKQWEENGKTGPSTQFMCREHCKRRYSIANCNCTDIHILLLYPDDVPCMPENICLTPQNIIDCVDECTQACFSQKYSLQVEEDDIFREPSISEQVFRKLPTTKSLITLMNRKTEITTFNYKPQYMSIEILSYVGGYIGIWLGISLVAVFNFLESFLVQLPDILREREKKKMKKQARLFTKSVYT